jgi:hypothetical protein
MLEVTCGKQPFNPNFLEEEVYLFWLGVVSSPEFLSPFVCGSEIGGSLWHDVKQVGATIQSSL